MCCVCGGGQGQTEEPLDAPEWEIDLDYTQAESYAEELNSAYEDLQYRMQNVATNWQTDRQLIDDYYWNYELLPLLEEGARLDERTLRTAVTWIVDGTEIQGQPMIDVFPEVEEWMLSNYNEDGETLIDRFQLEYMPMMLP